MTRRRRPPPSPLLELPILALLVLVLATPAPRPIAAQASFDLTIVGAQISDWSFLEPYIVHPGDDIALGASGLAEIVVRCARGATTPLQAQLTEVDLPSANDRSDANPGRTPGAIGPWRAQRFSGR